MNRVRECISWPLVGRGNIAIHEAGHLVTASLLGMTTAGAIADSDSGCAAIGVGTNPAPSLKQLPDKEPEPDLLAELLKASYPECWPGKTFDQAVIAYATMLLAGRQAELIHADIRVTKGQRLVMRDSDHLLAESLLQRIGYSHLAIGRCQHDARVLLKRHWSQVVQVSSSIKGRG